MTTTLSPSPARRRRRRHVASLVASAALAGPVLMAAAGPAVAAPMPTPLACLLVDFRLAVVDPLVSPDPAATKHRLTVVGNLAVPATVTLEPLTYIVQPEHWGIEVRACSRPGPNSQDDALMPPPPFQQFKASLDFTGTLGSCGIDVIGATRHQTFDLAGPTGCGQIGPLA
jgi:hypothetical protein